MKTKSALLVAAQLGLCLAILVLAVRLADRVRTARLELGRVQPTVLEAATLQTLAELEDPVFVTYYVSARGAMPPRLRRLEAQVTELLDALARASNGRLAYQIVDPASDPERTRYAAGQRVAPFRVRTVRQDAFEETEVWSTLTVASGAAPVAVLNGVSPELLPVLQRLLRTTLASQTAPRAPRFQLLGEEGDYERLAEWLSERGELVRGGPGDPIDPRADLLFWMDPAAPGPETWPALESFLASGRSLVLAASRQRAKAGFFEEEGGPSEPGFRLAPASAADPLWDALGLRPREGLLLDERNQAMELGDEPVPLPFLVRCIAPNQDFHAWVGQPNGTLFFDTPTALVPDPTGLEASGFEARVLATSSDRATRIALPAEPWTLARLEEERARATAVPKEPLVVLLEPADPWRGSVLCLASSSPWRDELLEAPGFAHRSLLELTVQNLAARDRLVAIDLERPQPEPLPELAAGTRQLWRALALFGLPLPLCLWTWRRRGSGAAGSPREGAGGLVRALRPAALALGVLLLVRGAGALSLSADLSADGLNSLAPGTAALAAKARGANALTVEWGFSPTASLPPELRAGARRLRALLGSLEEAGAELDLRLLEPEAWSVAEREERAAEGWSPFRHASRVGHKTRVHEAYARLRLSSGGREEWLAFETTASFAALELRLAAALWRLQGGRAPHVAFASDVPRLSAAEAHQDYQQRGLFAPSGSDVYSRVRGLLEANDFRVTHLNPRRPDLPEEEVDLWVWLQPRRDVTPLLQPLIEKLAGGASLLIAAQHFNVQRQQHRGTGFEVVYWPQPQLPDLENHYLPELGIELVRDVLFDALMTSTTVEAQVNRDPTERDYEAQESALPFLVRASAENFGDHPWMRGLGDQAFLWASRLRWDEGRLAELGIRATPLVRSSEHTWVYAWEGGYLPPELLEGPPSNPEGEPRWEGSQVLAALFEGSFPMNAEPLREELPIPAAPAPAPGRLVLVGCSELFKDARLSDERFRGEELFLNLVAGLALSPELSAVATHRPAARGFGYVPPRERLFWRLGVPFAWPILLLLFALARQLLAPRVA